VNLLGTNLKKNLIDCYVFNRHAAHDVQSTAVGEGSSIKVTSWVTRVTLWTLERAFRLSNVHQQATAPSPVANLGHDQKVSAIYLGFPTPYN
jgi:hypothetical protein